MLKAKRFVQIVQQRTDVEQNEDKISLGILSEHMLWVQSSDNNLDHENLSRRLQCFPLVDMKSAQILSGINPDHRHQSEILALLENYEDKRVVLFLIFLIFCHTSPFER